MSIELYKPPEGSPKADVAPNMIGNAGVKELVLAAICYFEPKHAKKTSIPILVIAKSGGGKSAFFEGCKETFKDAADILPVDALTSGQTHGMRKGKKVIKANLAYISLFDEINKWMQHNMEGALIPIFGAETGTRFREGEKIPDTSDAWNTLPIGTLLPYWQDFEGGGAEASKKVHNIQQIMRRCLLLRLDEDGGFEDLTDYLDQTASGIFENVTYKLDYDSKLNYNQVKKVVHGSWVLKQRRPIRFIGDWEAAKKRVELTTPRIQFTERVSYGRAFAKSALRLSAGLALRYGRTNVYIDDVNRVCDILEQNAKKLGFWRTICPECKNVCVVGSTKCGKCSATLPE